MNAKQLLSPFAKGVFVLSVLFLSTAFAAEENEIGIELVPRGRPFQLTFADPRELRMGLGYQGGNAISAMVGNYFSILGVAPKQQGNASDPTKPWFFHFGLEGAGFFWLRQADARFPLETVDGLFGLYAEARVQEWQFQCRYTHISAHLADGAVGTPSAYSREFLSLRSAYAPTPFLDVYAGFLLLTNSIPKLPALGAQLGGYFFLPWVPGTLTPFIAADLKWQQATPTNPSLSLQLGVALFHPPEAYRSLRLFYGYYTGADPRGQYFTRSLTTHSLGLEVQI